MKMLTILNLILFTVSFILIVNVSNQDSSEKSIPIDKKVEKRLDEITRLEAKYKILISEVETAKTVTTQSADKVNAYLKKATSGLPLMKVQSGFVHLNKDKTPELVEVKGCNGKRGVFNKFVEFESAFSVAPEIILSLESFDFWDGHDHRFKTEIRNVTKKGFEMDAFTWCDTKTSMLKIKWLAIGVT